jgi:hypothetical protein
MRKQQVLKCADISALESGHRYVDAFDVSHADSVVAVPIFLGAEVIGVIACLDARDDELAQCLSKYFSLVICSVFRYEHRHESRGRRLKILLHWCK